MRKKLVYFIQKKSDPPQIWICQDRGSFFIQAYRRQSISPSLILRKYDKFLRFFENDYFSQMNILLPQMTLSDKIAETGWSKTYTRCQSLIPKSHKRLMIMP